MITIDIFVVSSQTLARFIRPFNCLRYIQNLSLHSQYNLWVRVNFTQRLSEPMGKFDWGFYSGADQRKYQSSASLAFVGGIHRWPVNSPHKWPVTRKMFPFDDVIMITYFQNMHALWYICCTAWALRNVKGCTSWDKHWHLWVNVFVWRS